MAHAGLPCTRLVLAGRKERDKVESAIATVDYATETRLLDAETGKDTANQPAPARDIGLGAAADRDGVTREESRLRPPRR